MDKTNREQAEQAIEDTEKAIENEVMAIGKGAMGFNQEFMLFLQKYQVIGLAVAFVIGTAATKLVNSTVTDVIMPITAVVIPNGDWRTAVLQVGPVMFQSGDFVGAIIDFMIIAIFIFLTVKYIMKGDVPKKP